MPSLVKLKYYSCYRLFPCPIEVVVTHSGIVQKPWFLCKPSCAHLGKAAFQKQGLGPTTNNYVTP
jgi:hypothetical protein